MNTMHKSNPRLRSIVIIAITMTIAMTIAMIFITFSLPNVSAIPDSTYQYKLYDTISIKNPCYYNGTFCSAASVCNITIYDPNNAVIINNKAMTNSISYFNYTLLNVNNNYSLGLYKCDMTCTDFGSSGSQTFYFEVITGGNLSLFIILLISSFLLVMTAIYVNNEYIGFIGGAVFIITGLYSLIYGVANLANMYTDTIGYVTLGLGLFFFLAAGYSAINESGFLSRRDQAYEDSLSDDVWGNPNN